MVLYGCTELEKNITFSKVLYNCKGSRYSLYSWAKDAPSLELPVNVGFPVGQEDNPIKYLGVSIHYADPSSEPDFSGMTLHITTERPKYLAGTFELGSYYTGYIPPGRNKVVVNMSCLYNKDFEIHPFAFRVHSHNLGKNGFK
uniref:Peptidylglycine monooxygenase n=1 Tax=Acrobeloides nanus TaxID=290746 RepID=A0A914E9L5_9BILA